MCKCTCQELPPDLPIRRTIRAPLKRDIVRLDPTLLSIHDLAVYEWNRVVGRALSPHGACMFMLRQIRLKAEDLYPHDVEARIAYQRTRIAELASTVSHPDVATAVASADALYGNATASTARSAATVHDEASPASQG